MVIEAMLQSPHFLFRLEKRDRSEVEAVCDREPAFVCAVGHACPTRNCCCCRDGATLNRQGVERQRAACWTIRARKEAMNEFVEPVAPFRPYSDRQEGSPHVSAVHARDCRGDDRRDAHLSSGPRLERSQFMDLFTADYGFVNGDLAAI